MFLHVSKEMIHLEGIPNLSGLVQSFDQQQLANFCRILSVTISEPDVGNDDKHTLLAKNAQQKRNASPSRAEVNQGTSPSEPRPCSRLFLLFLPLFHTVFMVFLFVVKYFELCVSV